MPLTHEHANNTSDSVVTDNETLVPKTTSKWDKNARLVAVWSTGLLPTGFPTSKSSNATRCRIVRSQPVPRRLPPVLAQNLHKAEKDWRFLRAGHTATVMVTILSAIFSIFEFRVRSRISLELELIALRHQVTVLRRQRPGRPQLSSLDRLLWVWLYRIWPQVIDTMVLVKPVTVVQWHRKGFRLYWRWRSRRPGRLRIGTEIRDLIRRMSRANPLWGARPCVYRKPCPF